MKEDIQKSIKGIIGVIALATIIAVFDGCETEYEQIYREAENLNYTVLGENDFSFNGRKRISIYIYSPYAVTKTEKINVSKKAALDMHRKTLADFIDIRLEAKSTNYGKSDVKVVVEYAPDFCGISGNDCTGSQWEIKTY